MSFTIDPSIAEVVHIDSVAVNESLTVIYTNSEGWPGQYEVFVWNSSAKNTLYKMTGALTTDDKDMAFQVWPSKYDIKDGKFYYEIWNIDTNQIEFKGDLITRK
ncbi:hypothetical protein FNO01nite_30630 [Flavobacterium noncentrifugens]|uniref:Uncharacterized protein n=1 Tax=Flavobacterium noncentrifugens TaxID=1128970 RepID=A0A1G9BXK0_9FLAO|nr:hypothetical protein [Flavobacterium noncentrifugens]GEP52391.1 hypothetical protein FNO01nite_30630 [Flavobacterium noncentrifugens]SDK43685.1 hypothetical protein SAMN04487935_3377 [Flavobacterium noncentrifugens]